ncbi:MAG: DUF721 domain-containing protein [Paracoccaceae bacterium]
MAEPTKHPSRRLRGFEQTGGLLGRQIRKAGETRGFAVAKVLTHWAEIVGEPIARIAHPVKISYGQGGLGATLTLLTTGPNAPMLEMQKEALREKVNACYGYNAVSRIRLTQTAPTGFAEGQAAFAPAPPAEPTPPDPAIARRAAETAAGISDAGLREALETLARNVLTRAEKKERP